MLLYIPPYTKWETRAIMKVVLVHLIRAYVEPMGKLHAFLTLSGYGSKESNCTTGTHWTGSWLDHTTSPNTLKREKSLPVGNPTDSCHPAHRPVIIRHVHKSAKRNLLSCLSVHMEQCSSHWIDFHIWYLKTFQKCPENSSHIQINKNNWHFTWRWIREFLLGRTQRVRVGGHLSEEVRVTSGVPQGSVLGPLLLLAYVNDISRNNESTIRFLLMTV